MHDKDREKAGEGSATSKLIKDPTIYEDICEKTNDLIQCVDKKGRFVYVNNKWMQTLGYSAVDITKLKLNDILHPGHRRKYSQLFKRVCRGETIEDIETIFLNNKGEPIVVHGNVKLRMMDGRFFTTIGIFSDITLQKMGEETLMKSKEKYRLISENTSDLIAVLDVEGNHIYVSPSYSQLGYEPTELIGTSGLELIHPDDKKALLPLMLRYARTKIKELFKLKMKRVTEHINFRIPDKSGKWHFFESTANLIENIDGKGYNFLLISHDVTGRKLVEEALIESEKRYRELVEKAGIAILIDDIEGNFKYYNKRFAELFGYEHSEMVGMSSEQIVHPDDLSRVTKYRNAMLQNKDAPGIYEFKGIKKGSTLIPIEANITPLTEGERIIGIRSYFWDISDRKQIEEELRLQSIHDALTGLYNRRGFLALTNQQRTVADRTGKGFFVVYADLDKMKKINDVHGHAVGDQALKAIAEILTTSFRKSDVIGRLGGDEFAVCAIEALADSTQVMINRIRNNLDDYNRLNRLIVSLSLSVGTAYYDPKKPCRIEELLEKADQMMYLQKNRKDGNGL